MTKSTANPTDARELALYAVNDSETYRHATCVIENLAKKMAKGTYDATKAPTLWAYVADSAARNYARDQGEPQSGFGWFSKATRQLAALEIGAHYAEELEARATLLKTDAENKRRWTVGEIAHANEQAGFFFFSRATMKSFGDTFASWRVECCGGLVFLRRVRPMRDRDGRDMGGVGQLREFFPATGSVGCPIKGESQS